MNKTFEKLVSFAIFLLFCGSPSLEAQNHQNNRNKEVDEAPAKQDAVLTGPKIVFIEGFYKDFVDLNGFAAESMDRSANKTPNLDCTSRAANSFRDVFKESSAVQQKVGEINLELQSIKKSYMAMTKEEEDLFYEKIMPLKIYATRSQGALETKDISFFDHGHLLFALSGTPGPNYISEIQGFANTDEKRLGLRLFLNVKSRIEYTYLEGSSSYGRIFVTNHRGQQLVEKHRHPGWAPSFSSVFKLIRSSVKAVPFFSLNSCILTE
jgi:hypothetical protein